jgi:hypothetical protein
VPRFLSPPTRLASSRSRSCGVWIERRRTRAPKPGAWASMRACRRSANASASPGLGQTGELARSVAPHRLGNVGVGPDGLGAGRGPGRVGRRHLAEEHEGPVGELPGRQLCRVDGQLVHRGGQVHGAGAGDGRVGPRDRAVECPVDLERRRAGLVAIETLVRARRDRTPIEQVSVQLRCHHVGEDTMACPRVSPLASTTPQAPSASVRIPVTSLPQRTRPPIGVEPLGRARRSSCRTPLPAPASRDVGRCRRAASRAVHSGRWPG